MHWLTELFTESSIAHDILVYSLVIALGLTLGKIRFFGVSLGITWVLFVAIFFANIGLSVGRNLLISLKNSGWFYLCIVSGCR